MEPWVSSFPSSSVTSFSESWWSCLLCFLHVIFYETCRACLLPILQIGKLRRITLFMMNESDIVCWGTSKSQVLRTQRERWLAQSHITIKWQGKASNWQWALSNTLHGPWCCGDMARESNSFPTLAENHLDPLWAQPMALNRSQEWHSPGKFWPGTYLQNSRGDGNIPTYSLQTQISNFLILPNPSGNANYVILV